ncbi:MAG TPA: hypothetical protein VFP15_07975 [Gemmatimonadaceae bacterium]|nr:hypothetical protein [Gemmatimonadaceae bacterium]
MKSRPFGRGLALYVLASAAAIVVAALVFVMVYGGAAERRAIVISAIVALVVQGIACAVARLMARGGDGIAGWTLGAVICLVAIFVFGFVSRALGLPSNAALLSLATFFFLTELIEPPFLNL